MAFHQQPARPSPQRVIPFERRDSLSSPAGGPQHQQHPQHPQYQQHPQHPHPQRQRLRRSSRTGDLPTPPTAAAVSTPTGDEDPEQTWVLFAPASDSHTTSYLSSISSPATPGRSQFSELGSPRPAARAASRSRYGRGGAESDADGDDGVLLDGASLAGEDDTELDSLDGHLAEFRGHAGMYQQPVGSSYNLHHQQQQQQQQNRRHRRESNYQTQPAQTPRLPHLHPQPQPQQHHQMPSHDGLGSFRIHQPATAPEVQEQIYAHERYNRRRLRRRDSVEQARREEEEALSREAEKMQRIEAWRLEQSRILLDEIQKLTRQRRRQSHTPQPPRRDSYRMRRLEEEGDDVMAGHDMAVSAAPERTMSRRPPPSDRESVNWHDEEAAVGFSAEDEEDDDPEDGFWTRITKRVIRELMGIDDRLLSILFGETLPDDEDLIITPRPPSPLSASGMREAFSSSGSSWQLHVLERVAKELGMLVNHLSHHPGAFSTYNRMQQMPIPYAGLPVIPESTTAEKPPRRGPAAQQTPESRPSVSRGAARGGSCRAGEPHGRSRAAARSGSAAGGASGASATSATLFTQEEWEQDLDIKLVFRYLRSRFVDSSPPSSSSSSSYSPSHFEPPGSPSPAPLHLASVSMQDAAAKSARVRQNHPLIGGGGGAAGRPRAAYQAPSSSAPYPPQQWPRHAPGPAAPIAPAGIASTLTSTTNAVMAAASATVARVRRAASCATLGSMRSVATTAATKQSGCSSRNYWDFGGGGAAGSVGTGSVVASASAGGPMGSWGEV